MSYHTRVSKSMMGSGDISIHSVQFWVIQKNIFQCGETSQPWGESLSTTCLLVFLVNYGGWFWLLRV
jgi:hypothetical protein